MIDGLRQQGISPSTQRDDYGTKRGSQLGADADGPTSVAAWSSLPGPSSHPCRLLARVEPPSLTTICILLGRRERYHTPIFGFSGQWDAVGSLNAAMLLARQSRFCSCICACVVSQSRISLSSLPVSRARNRKLPCGACIHLSTPSSTSIRSSLSISAR